MRKVKTMLYVANSFSLNMIGTLLQKNIIVRRISEFTAVEILQESVGDRKNIIGHKSTDDIVRNYLEDCEVFINPGKRETITLTENDALLVAQYIGPRLEEGTTVLPSEAKIEWIYVQLDSADRYIQGYQDGVEETTIKLQNQFTDHWRKVKEDIKDALDM